MRTRIGTRLMVAFVLIVMLMVGLALYLMDESRKSLEESVGRSSVFLAQEMLKRMNQGVYLKIEELQSHSKHLVLKESISESNRDFEKLADREAYLNQKEREWVSAPKDEITPFMEELIGSDLSKHLRGDLIEFYEEKYGYKTILELILTNRYGANVAQTGKTSDYRQDDEEWWQMAREKGYYVTPVEYDESTGEYALSIGLRVDDEEGNFMGVMKAVVDVKSIMRSAEIAVRKYETTRIKIITKDGKLIYRTTAFKFLEDVSDKEFFKQIKGESGFFVVKKGGKETQYSYVLSKGYRDFEGPGWILVVGHDVQEILKPVFQLRNRILAASLILIILVIIVAILISRSITKPLSMLTKGVTQIGKGDRKHRVDIKTKDEIGELAAAFNEMVEKRQQAEVDLVKVHDELEIRVQERTAELAESNASLKHEITDRERAEERAKHLNLVLRALRNTNKLIVTEKDQHRLIKSACDNFIITRGYHNAWIALFDESGNFTAAAEAGVGETFSRMLEMLKRGDLMRCCREALGQSGVVVITNPVETCKDCPQAKGYAGREAMTIRLEYEDKVYGILSVSVPKGVVTDREELAFFNEVAGDIAFALYNIETEGSSRATEGLLRESEEKYRVLVENANDSILVIQDDIIKFHNSMAEEKTGFSFEELDNTPFINLIHPEDRDMVHDRYERRLKGEKLPASHSFRVVNKAGEELWVHLNSTVVNWDGRPATLNFIRDITELKKLEAQLVQAQKMEAIGTLAGGVAHDFNNLLTSILGNAELELMNLGKDNPICESLKEIVKAGKSATSLTRQLLAFSRRQVLQPVVLNLNTVTADMDKMLRRMIGEDIDLKTFLEPDLGNVTSDPGQIEQVLINLAVNARDAMPQGGKFTVETANVDLEEDFFVNHGVIPVPGPYVMLAVTDTGSGMDKEIQSRIFEPFFTTKEIGKGTGLGLSTVYGIVKQSNGYIWAYSEPGRGTTFKIYLSRVGGEEVLLKKEKGPTDKLKGSEAVLIVEDDAALRNLAQKALQQYGYRVLEAENGEEALRVSKEHEGPIDLMITDVVMPKMCGRETAERLQPLYPQMKVIYMSGYTDNAIAHHGVLEPGLNFLEKPFTPEGLARKVREVLDG